MLTPMRRIAVIPALVAATLFAGCSGNSQPTAPNSPQIPAQTSPAESPAPGAATHWGYEGAEGPEHWGELPDAEACGIGKAQSPIDLTGEKLVDLADIGIEYRPSSFAVTNTGHSMQAVYDSGSFATIDGRQYELKQIHHHTPSEHTVDGKHVPAELHFVHQDADGKLAVLGVLIEEGTANETVQRFIDSAPAEVGATAVAASDKLDANSLLPAKRDTFRYSGSLTTPPCTEGVTWVVFTTPITASAQQLSKLAGLSGQNNRPVQDLEGRKLEKDLAAA